MDREILVYFIAFDDPQTPKRRKIVRAPRLRKIQDGDLPRWIFSLPPNQQFTNRCGNRDAVLVQERTREFVDRVRYPLSHTISISWNRHITYLPAENAYVYCACACIATCIAAGRGGFNVPHESGEPNSILPILQRRRVAAHLSKERFRLRADEEALGLMDYTILVSPI
jgi:hypothetical protein